MSEVQLQRMFSAWAAISPKRLLQYLTKEHALTMLRGSANVLDAALAAKVFPTAPQAGRLHLLLRGTNFQIKVWEALLKIPPATLASYGRLAGHLAVPRAARDVGSAVAANRIAWLIPCHRVIREDGLCGNYRWGVERKLALRVWESGRASAAV